MSNTQPSIQSGAASERNDPVLPRLVGVGVKILLVDDQPAKLLSYEAVLSGLGVSCMRALSGNEALGQLLKHDFAAILLDVNMPGMDGFEAARMIRAHPRFERTPIIFITAFHSDELSRLKGYEVGAIDYISVPVAPEVLRSKVAVLVELFQRRSELQELNKALQEAHERLEGEHARALRASEQRYRLAAEAVQGLVYEWDVPADRVTHSKGLTTLLGFIPEDVPPTSLWWKSRIHTEDIPALENALKRRNPDDDGHREIDLRAQHRDGHWIYVRDHFIAIWGDAGELLRVVGNAMDVTKQRLAEEHLRENAERFRLITETIPQLVWSARPDGFSDYFNQRYLDYLGMTLDEMQGFAWSTTVHPEDFASAVTAWNHAVSTGEDYSIEFRIRQGRTGPYRWHAVHGIPLRDASGRVLRWFGTCTDVDDRRRSEEALRDSERRHRALLENAPVGVVHASMTGRIEYANAGFCELVGYTADELLTRTWQDITHPDDLERDQLLGRRVLTGEIPHYTMEKRYVRKDGTSVWVELFGNFVLDDNGRPVQGVGIVINIAERKQSDNALRDSEERFRALANTIDQFAWTCDQLGYANWYNDRWYDYTGTTFEEMRADGWKKVMHPAHLERVVSHLRHCLFARQSWEDTFPIRGKNGGYRWFLSRAVPIRAPDGEVVRWFGTNTDVTDLRVLQQALEEAGRRKDEFLAMLAHELRNPVAPIRNAAEALAKLSSYDGQQLALINMIRRQTRHLARLLDDLLDVARINQGRIELRREITPVQTFVDAAIETAAPLIREKEHRIHVTPASGAPLFVLADTVRMTQGLANLLGNATKFTPEGGDIRVITRQDGDYAVVEVSDTGIGIAPELLPHIFEMFVQGTRSLDRSEGGLGIGLSVCKQVVELHGGTITAASSGEGRGTIFVIRLPLVAPPGEAGKEISTLKSASRRVLIVDDNHDAADSLASLLKLQGHDVEAVYSSAAALERTRESPAEVVVLDIGLPQINGYELAEHIRAVSPPSLRLIALSGYGRLEDKHRAMAAGFDLHLIKPVDLEALHDAITAT